MDICNRQSKSFTTLQNSLRVHLLCFYHDADVVSDWLRLVMSCQYFPYMGIQKMPTSIGFKLYTRSEELPSDKSWYEDFNRHCYNMACVIPIQSQKKKTQKRREVKLMTASISLISLASSSKHILSVNNIGWLWIRRR